jgi:branched-chain amino acid transport system permease protein
LAIATLALSEVLRTIVIMLPEITGGAVGLGIPPLFGGNRVLNYYLVLAIAVIALSTLYAVRRSKLYLALVTLRCDEVVASSIGINPIKYRLYAFLLSALFPGLCGGFFSFYVGFIDPFSVFNIEISIAPQIMSVLGGIYTFWGPIIGALIIEPVKEFLRISMPTGYLVVYGIIMILCIRFLPRGIMEALKAYTGMSEAVPVGGRKCSR